MRWSSYGIGSYTITVHYGGLGGFGGPINITVREGKLVEVDFSRVSETMDESYFPTFQRFTIDRLFNASFNCVIYCGVTYDATYRFPTIIDQGGFFGQGDYIEISNFQPILAE